MPPVGRRNCGPGRQWGFRACDPRRRRRGSRPHRPPDVAWSGGSDPGGDGPGHVGGPRRKAPGAAGILRRRHRSRHHGTHPRWRLGTGFQRCCPCADLTARVCLLSGRLSVGARSACRHRHPLRLDAHVRSPPARRPPGWTRTAATQRGSPPGGSSADCSSSPGSSGMGTTGHWLPSGVASRTVRG